jgi:Uma2 family endonuclease
MIAPNLPTVTRLHAGSTGLVMTPEEFDAIEDYDRAYRYELLNGVVIVTPPAEIGERSPNDELGYLIRRYRDDHPEGRRIDDTAFEQYIRVENGRRIADRAIWIGLGRAPDTTQDIPTIAVEFVSRQARDWRRDHLEKRYEYLQSGVTEYWVIDRFRRIMTVYRGEQDELTLQPGETYTTDHMPGFELPLDRILEVSDRYKD